PVTGHIQPGRPFRRKHKTQRPLAARNEHWRSATRQTLVDVDVREEVAAGWRSMAAAEAASVAAFSSLSQQLLAIGAPSEFLVMAHEDALDEIEHARLCYETARSIDGKPLGAAPFAAALLPGPRTVTDLSFAKDCLKESCVMEGAAADIARQLVPLTSPPLRAVMETIASDEARHAAHGWLMLEWLVTQRGVDIDALMDVVHQLRNESFGNHTDDRFERYGLAGSDRWTSTVHASIDNAEERLGSLRVGELAG
ncbi:MAG: ferritin-like domain-containing protein, partial [Myxococcota bacterium]